MVRVTLNDEPCSEGKMNAAYAVLQGIPVGLASGDDAVCEESRGLYPGVRTAQVKTAIDRYSARCLTSETPYRRIRDEAKAAVEDGEKLRAYAPERPYSFAVEFDNVSSAASVLYFPGIERLDDRLVSWTHDDYEVAYKMSSRCPDGGGVIPGRHRGFGAHSGANQDVQRVPVAL